MYDIYFQSLDPRSCVGYAPRVALEASCATSILIVSTSQDINDILKPCSTNIAVYLGILHTMEGCEACVASSYNCPHCTLLGVLVYRSVLSTPDREADGDRGCERGENPSFHMKRRRCVHAVEEAI